MPLRMKTQQSETEDGEPSATERMRHPSPTLVVRPQKTPRVRALRPEYPEYLLRPRSFAGSVALHVTVIAALFLLPGIPYHTAQPIYEELIKPDAHKIVWYNYPKKKLPDVDAPKRIGVFPKPVGSHRAESAIIATSPKPKSEQQIIWQPVPKVEIHQDLPTPNLIARAATAIPAPPPPPEPKPKVEKPESEGVKAPQPNPSPKQPEADVNKAQQTPAPIEVPKPRKAFVAPPVSPRQARLPVPVQPSDIPMPDTSIVGSSATKSALPAGLGTAVISKGAPPPPEAPPGPSNNAGNAKVDIAIASLHPSDKPGPIPEGSRPGQFAQSPLVGEIATGDVSGTGLTVPNLTVRDRTKLDPPPVSANRKVVLYADRVRTVSVSTLSVPLRPASRTIPRAIDARFQGRNVYTMVLPIENITPYSGDWILWFAERQVRPGETPFVRAPVPLRKFESVEPILPGTRSELRVQFAAVITKEGKLDNLALLRSVNPVLDQVVLQDLATWEFKPATRDGAPIDVEVVLEIPFILPTQIAKGTQP
jgi:hypothetical protein